MCVRVAGERVESYQIKLIDLWTINPPWSLREREKQKEGGGREVRGVERKRETLAP